MLNTILWQKMRESTRVWRYQIQSYPMVFLHLIKRQSMMPLLKHQPIKREVSFLTVSIARNPSLNRNDIIVSEELIITRVMERVERKRTVDAVLEWWPLSWELCFTLKCALFLSWDCCVSIFCRIQLLELMWVISCRTFVRKWFAVHVTRSVWLILFWYPRRYLPHIQKNKFSSFTIRCPNWCIIFRTFIIHWVI